MAASSKVSLTRQPSERRLPFGVVNFSDLPDQARLNSRSLKILLGISNTTFWRRKKEGQIQEPDLHGTWSVGYVRKLLAETQPS